METSKLVLFLLISVVSVHFRAIYAETIRCQAWKTFLSILYWFLCFWCHNMIMEDFLKSHNSISKKTSLCIMVINTDDQESWFSAVGPPLYALQQFLFFAPFPPVLSYHVVTLELWQLLHENGDPHIIFNNNSKSAKVNSVQENWVSNEKNPNLEDKIGVPFGICLKCSNSRQ